MYHRLTIRYKYSNLQCIFKQITPYKTPTRTPKYGFTNSGCQRFVDGLIRVSYVVRCLTLVLTQKRIRVFLYYSQYKKSTIKQ